MAMTIKGKVSFDIKMVVPSDMEAIIIETLRELVQQHSKGVKLTGIEAALVKASLVDGPEGAIKLDMKSGIAQMLREELGRDGIKVSNVAVRV